MNHNWGGRYFNFNYSQGQGQEGLHFAGAVEEQCVETEQNFKKNISKNSH